MVRHQLSESVSPQEVAAESAFMAVAAPSYASVICKPAWPGRSLWGSLRPASTVALAPRPSWWSEAFPLAFSGGPGEEPHRHVPP